MSTIQTNLGCLRPNRPNALQQRLAVLLVRDEQRPRPRPTLAGRSETRPPPPPPHTPPQHTPPPSRVLHGPQLDHVSCRAEPEPEDMPYAQLLKMDTAFIRRVERAFRSGGENRRAAAATYGAISTRPR